MIRDRLGNLKQLVTEGYKEGNGNSMNVVKSKYDSIREDSLIKSQVYAFSAIVGAGSYDLEEIGTHFIMGYEVARSKHNNDGFTPFAQPLDFLEKIFDGPSYRVGERVGRKVFSLKDKLRMNH